MLTVVSIRPQIVPFAQSLFAWTNGRFASHAAGDSRSSNPHPRSQLPQASWTASTAIGKLLSDGRISRLQADMYPCPRGHHGNVQQMETLSRHKMSLIGSQPTVDLRLWSSG